MLVATAEETVTRSYDTGDIRERRELAVTALNLLHAANPTGQRELGLNDRASQLDWWDGEGSRPGTTSLLPFRLFRLSALRLS